MAERKGSQKWRIQKPFQTATSMFSFMSGLLPHKPLFVILSPKIIHPNTIHNVTVFTEEKDARLNVRLSVYSDGAHYDTEWEILGGQITVLGIQIKELPNKICSLWVEVKFKYAFQDFVYKDSKKLYNASKSSLILIQLDKPIYKPGDVIKYRVVFLNYKLCPFSAKGVEIEISDPQHNVIRVHQIESISKGLFSEEMQLSNEPNLGDWEICVKFEDEKEKQNFQVEQCILPTFDLEIKLPNFITNERYAITTEIIATNNYGKGVKGQVSAKLMGQYNYTKGTPESTTVTFPFDSSACIDMKIPHELRPEIDTWQNVLKIVVTVTEGETGVQRSETREVTMYEIPFKIEQINRQEYYELGLEVQLSFKISDHNNLPIADDHHDALKISHPFTHDNTIDSVYETSIPKTGIVTFSVKVTSNAYLKYRPIVVRYKGMEKSFPPPRRISLRSKRYIKAFIGEGNTINVEANEPMKAVNYIVIVDGKIVHSGRQNCKMRKQIVIHYDLNINCFYGLKAAILVFAILGHENEVLVDSVSYPIKIKLSNYLTIKTSKGKIAPGEKVTISLETHPNSLVAFHAVDRSGLLPHEEKGIGLDRICDAAGEQFSPPVLYKPREITPKLKIFNDSGIVVFTNCLIDNPCLQVNRRKFLYEQRIYNFLGTFGRRPSWGRCRLGEDLFFWTKAFSYKYNDDFIKWMEAREKQKRMSQSVTPVRFRENFPESWVWDAIHTDESKLEISKTVPDTLTSWVLTGFSLHPELGIGVMASPEILEIYDPSSVR